MTDQDSNRMSLGRRTFLKAAGLAAGAGTFGADAVAADAQTIGSRFLNWRTVEAQKVWDRGYRGRPDRAVGINETGADTRHPELGPWNNVLIEKDGEGIELKEVSTEQQERPVLAEVDAGTETFVGTGRPLFFEPTRTFTLDEPAVVGATATEQATGSFQGSAAGGDVPPAAAPGSGGTIYTSGTFSFEPADAGADETVVGYRIDATLTWSQPGPTQAADLELRLQKGGSDIATSGGTVEPESTAERLSATQGVEPGADYNFVVESASGTATEWTIEYSVQTLTQPAGFEPVSLADPGYRVDATITWNEQVSNPTDTEPTKLQIELRNNDGDVVASAGNAFVNTFYSDTELTLSAEVPPDAYHFRVSTSRGVTDWKLVADLTRVEQTDRTETREVRVTEPFEGDPVPDADTDLGADTPKTIGWYNTGRYLDSDVPRDPNGHGTHVTSIAAGSGRASTIDFDNTEVHEPRAVLLPGDVVEYEVDARAGTTVFASAFGEGLQVDVVGPDGEVLREAPMRGDSIIADAPTEHDGGTATYTVRARPFETEASTGAAAERAQEGNPGAARLNRIAVGSYRHPPETAGARPSTDDPRAVHPGMAPNGSILSLEGYLEPSADFNDIADDLVETFNVRTMNHSWGFPFGVPWGQFGGAAGPVWNTAVDVLLGGGPTTEAILTGIESATEAGILNVAAAGNSFTPANGNSLPAVAEEAISVVATGPLDGITSYSSGGVGGTDTEQEDAHAKPDVTAPGGDLEPDAVGFIALGTAGVSSPVPSRFEFVRAALAPGSSYDDGGELGDPPRDHVSVAGTSMASPYTCGVSSLVAEAMEFTPDGDPRRPDAPDAVTLPEPAETGFDDVMRLKQVLLATASETAFTAAPYHNAKTAPSTPAYTHGERDPYEGYGRVNPDAAVDAATRELVDADAAAPRETVSTTRAESVGLYIPEHSRAVAGFVDAEGGSLEASVEFQRYSGGNKGMAKGAPHLDLFVYDAATPAENGEPNVVASAQGLQGSASVSTSVPEDGGTYMIVAKLVNVPGAVNGFDVRAHFDLTTRYTAPSVPSLSADGSRSDDGSAFTGGQTNQVDVTVTNISSQVPDEATVAIVDRCPWDVIGGDTRGQDGEVVDLGTTTAREIRNSESGITRTYFARAPDSAGRDTFGPAEVRIDPVEGIDGTTATFGGTDTNTVVAAPSGADSEGGGDAPVGTDDTPNPPTG